MKSCYCSIQPNTDKIPHCALSKFLTHRIMRNSASLVLSHYVWGNLLHSNKTIETLTNENSLLHCSGELSSNLIPLWFLVNGATMSLHVTSLMWTRREFSRCLLPYSLQPLASSLFSPSPALAKTIIHFHHDYCARLPSLPSLITVFPPQPV